MKRARQNRIAVVTVALVALQAIAWPLSASAETIKGRFTYSDIDPLTGIAHHRPIAFGKVEIHRCGPVNLFDWCVWYQHGETLTTDADGKISVYIPRPVADEGKKTTYAVKVFASNDAAIVWPNAVFHNPFVPFHREPGQDDGSIINKEAHSDADVLDFTYHFGNRYTASHFNVAETLRHAHDYATARRAHGELADPLPPVNVQPSPSFARSHLDPGYLIWGVPIIRIQTTGNENDLTLFWDYLLLHEYAHYLQHEISTFAWIVSEHTGCKAWIAGSSGHPEDLMNSAELAWMEGWANYFAQAVASYYPPSFFFADGWGSPPRNVLESPPACSLPVDSGLYGCCTVRGPTGTILDFPLSVFSVSVAPCSGCLGPPARCYGPDCIENTVASALWHLGNESVCTPTGSGVMCYFLDDAVFGIFDYELDSRRLGHWPTIQDFRDAWLAQGLPRQPLVNVFASLGLPLTGVVQITCPSDTEVSTDPDQCSAVVTYPAPSVTESVAGLTVSCSPSSGSVFALGDTTVTCTAADASQVFDTCQFNVRVVDTQSPVIACSSDKEVSATTSAGAVVSYPAPSVSDNCPGVSAGCSPPNGSTFPIGTTTVGCTATDTPGNQTTCSFTVHVKGAAEQTTDLIALVRGFRLKSAIANSLIVKLNAALAAMNLGDTASACTKLQDCVNEANALKAKKFISAAQASQITAAAQQIKTVLDCP